MSLKKSTSFSFEINRNWHLIDVRTKTFGRLATEVVKLLMGKNKSTYSPQADSGDFVVAINTKFLKVSHSSKWRNKVYFNYTGYPGGIKEKNLENLMDCNPNEALRRAVYNMLPKNKLRAKRMNRFKLFATEKEGKELYEAMKKKIK